jgi:pimeloyl-ACP methyl ester carboxylesterase
MPVLRSALSAKLEILECQPEIETPRPSLLFVHGAFAGAWIFADHFLPYFAAAGFPSYALSLRGHGASFGRDALTWHSLADYVDDLEAVVEVLDPAPVLVGHSMGAVVVMKYLERAHASAAALLAPVPPQGLLAASLTLAFSKPSLLVELNTLLASGRASLEALHRALFAGPVPAEKLLDYYHRFQRESQRAIWDLTLFDLPQSWRMRRPPMLVLLAERDALFPVEQSRAGFAAIGLRTEVVEELGHAVMLEPGWQRAADRLVHWLTGAA